MSLAPAPNALRRNPFQRATQKTLDLLLPPLCLSCDAPVGSTHTLCPACWGDIHFIAAPFCQCCGAPFDVPVGDGMLCGGCISETPPFTSARAAMLYNDASKRLVLGFKHSDRTHPTKALAAWMARTGQDFLDQTDFIVPVPLHRWRLFKRRYNQAALLAQAIGQIAHKKVQVDLLQRTKPTPIQGHRNRKERHENVRGAFAVNPRCVKHIQGKTISLIDDVLTTGATVSECSRVLLKAGAKTVYVLTLARVKTYT